MKVHNGMRLLTNGFIVGVANIGITGKHNSFNGTNMAMPADALAMAILADGLGLEPMNVNRGQAWAEERLSDWNFIRGYQYETTDETPGWFDVLYNADVLVSQSDWDRYLDKGLIPAFDSIPVGEDLTEEDSLYALQLAVGLSSHALVMFGLAAEHGEDDVDLLGIWERVAEKLAFDPATGEADHAGGYMFRYTLDGPIELKLGGSCYFPLADAIGASLECVLMANSMSEELHKQGALKCAPAMMQVDGFENISERQRLQLVNWMADCLTPDGEEPPLLTPENFFKNDTPMGKPIGFEVQPMPFTTDTSEGEAISFLDINDVGIPKPTVTMIPNDIALSYNLPSSNRENLSEEISQERGAIREPNVLFKIADALADVEESKGSKFFTLLYGYEEHGDSRAAVELAELILQAYAEETEEENKKGEDAPEQVEEALNELGGVIEDILGTLLGGGVQVQVREV